jgi:hypothetical protein
VTSHGWRVRALLLLYSNANIAGCAIALCGPALLFSGVIERGWLLITLGLYVAGFLLARRPPELERQIEQSLTVEETLEHFDRLVQRAQPHLTGPMRDHLKSVRESVAQVLPRLLVAAPLSPELFTVRQTVLRYVPETLAGYVALPPAFRVTHVLQDGKTARELLSEQLALLDDQLRQVADNVARSDARALIENGRFLEQRFRGEDFLL